MKNIIKTLTLVALTVAAVKAVGRVKSKNKNIKFTIVDKDGNLLADYNGKDLIHFDSVDVEMY